MPQNGTRTCTQNWNYSPGQLHQFLLDAGPDHDTWTGCFTDRDQNYDTLNTTPTTSNTSTLFPAEEYTSGNDEILQDRATVPICSRSCRSATTGLR